MKRKLLLAALCVVGALGMRAQSTAPFLQEKDNFGGTAVSSPTTFRPTGTTYTLQVTGTANTEITVPGGSFSYTPSTSGTVRFVRNGGNVVYVYEGTTYKGTVDVSEPDAPTYPTSLTSASTENIIVNGGFEANTDLYSGQSDRWKPTPWNSYNSNKNPTGNGTSVRSGNQLTGSKNMLMHGDGYYLTQQLASGVMKSFTPYQISYEYVANDDSQKGSKYRFQVGSSEFASDYFNSDETPATTTTKETFSTTFVTPAVINQPYVQISANRSGFTTQRLDRFDEFILVAATGGGIGITGATGATCLLGSAYAPEGVLSAALENGPIDVTSRVTNPTFDTNLTGWNSPIGGGSEIKVADNRQDQTRYFYQTWNGTPKEGRMYQVIENLPSGTYELKMIAFADQAGTMTAASTAVAVYAQGQDVGNTSSDKIRPNYVGNVKFAEYKAYAYVDENGKLEIGMRQYQPAQFRWLGMDNVELKYVSTSNVEEDKMLEVYQTKWTAVIGSLDDILSDENYAGVLGKERADLSSALATTVSNYGDYKTRAEAAHNAYLTFINAKDAYATCVTEYNHYRDLSGTATYDSFISETTSATDVLNAIKTAEYTAVTTTYDTDGSALFIASWDVTNFDALDAQHWSSQNKTYYDKWYGSAFTCSISKTVTLPAGHYAFYAAGRGQGNSSSAVTLKVAYGETTLTQTYTMKGDSGKGIDTSGAANFGDGTYANNGAGRGWEWRYIAFDLDAETSVTLSIEGTGNNSWVSACDTKLLTYDNIAVTRQNYTAALEAAQAYQDDDMFEEDKTALNDAITNNTLNVNTATKQELEDAITALNAAATEAAADVVRYNTYTTANTTIDGGTNVDLTSLIVNPSFEDGLTGWTNTGEMATQTNSSFTKTGSKYLEFWQPNGTKGVSQTVGYLPAGVYKLAVRAKARGVTSAKVFANSNEQAMTVEDKENEYTLTFEIADKTAINIGFEGVGTGADASWFALDNFRLTYVGSIDDLTYTLAEGKMGTDKSAAQTAAEKAFLNDKNLANYNALLTAISEAEASVVNYATLKTAIDKAEDVKEANNFVTADATTALESEITTATAAWTDVTYTDAQATAEIAALGSAVSGWHGIGIDGKAGAFMASAWGKTSENWWDAPYINTWSTEGDNDGSGFSVPFFEWYVGDTENLPLNTTKTATLSNLDNGMYEVELWARVQRRTDANFGNNNEITMSVNDGDAVSIMNGASISGYEDKKAMRIGRFTARGKVTDGTLTLSIKTGGSGSNVHWLSWRDVKYTKLDEASLAVNSTVKYGTFVAPFDVDIPAGVTVYTIDEVNPKGNGSTLLATELTGTIPANTPVLLKAENGYEAQTVYGKAVAAEELTEGLLTGTYEKISAPEDSYVLQYLDNKAGFYQVVSGKQPTVKANRAYLTLPAGSGANVRALFFSADGEATAIAGIEALTSGNYDAIYTAGGVKVNALQKGLNIVVKDGKSHKIYVK